MGWSRPSKDINSEAGPGNPLVRLASGHRGLTERFGVAAVITRWPD
jgi:hypothetical protein